MAHERRQRLPEPAVLGLAERQERPAAALDEERGLAVEDDDVRPGNPRGARGRPLRPRERGPVRMHGVCCGEDERAAGAAPVAQALDRAGQGELRAPEPLDEVAAAADAERLELAELPVDGRVPARNALGADAVPGDDPLALEQELGEGARFGCAREKRRGR